MPEFAGTEDERREKASAPILAALNKAKSDFRDWQTTCDLIDDIYSREGEFYTGLMSLYGGEATWKDNDLDLFWSSMEVLKTAVYARPPKPAVKPLFSDGDRLKNKTAEILERASVSVFVRTGIDDVMCHVRDDVLFAGRGVIWLRYETEDGQKVCVEHLDRKDFLHETTRKWSEVGWVAGGFWLTFDQMVERFSKRGRKLSKDVLRGAKYSSQRDKDDHTKAAAEKCQVWEVWHRADNKVYWVTEGVDVLLDESEPELKLSGFFPCPRPAFATLRRRSLIPVPDWQRYAIHFRKIGDLTGRIYTLLDCVKLKGFYPGGGDLGSAIEAVLNSEDDQIMVPVPANALMAGAQGLGDMIVWMPLAEIAAAIQGLIEARAQLINDFYELSGISDIMRGATEAEETLGAQQLKSQYGSVRVRGKIDELQRIAAESVKIAAEIVAEKFTQKTILDMAQLPVPTKSELQKRVKEVEKAAEEELKALSKQAEQAAQSAEGVEPEQAQAALQQAQQQIFAKYAPMLAEVEKQVPVEDVMKLLRDDRARSFAFEVETDSTIMTDEVAEKASRNEFLAQFTTASQGLATLATMGEQGATLAGEMLKFVLSPYRASRQLDSAIEAFVEAAPQLAAQTDGDDGMAEATQKLAEAEAEKARAQMAKVEADSALKAAENQRKMAELQIRAENDRAKVMAEAEKLRQQAEANAVKAEEALAKVDLLRAQTMKALAEAGVTISSQQLDEFKSLKDIEMREADQAMAAANAATDREFRERGESRADRQQQLAERTPE